MSVSAYIRKLPEHEQQSFWEFAEHELTEDDSGPSLQQVYDEWYYLGRLDENGNLREEI